jgi:hypothetical protein
MRYGNPYDTSRKYYETIESDPGVECLCCYSSAKLTKVYEGEGDIPPWIFEHYCVDCFKSED